VAPQELTAPADGRLPDEGLLFVPDLLAEFCADHPVLAGRVLPVLPGNPRLAWPTDPVTRFDASNHLQDRLHQLIPGGAHTYARGSDQYPEQMAPVLVRGRGALVWDADNNCFVEYGAGLRSVTLGHAHPRVDAAVSHALRDGVNFSRPQRLEAMAAEEFLDQVPGAEMVKFAKNGSDVTTAAIKVARAHTGRDLVAICDQSFFSVDDWYISHTEMDRGIPAGEQHRGLRFAFNDLPALERLLDEHGSQVAAVILQPATSTQEPAAGYLAGVQALSRRHGAVLIFDEIITGFRWAAGGVQRLAGITPDLSCWAKGIGNGYAIAALTGSAALLDVGGLNTDQPRAFVLSTTYGPETVGLAALRAVLTEHRRHDPIGQMETAGRQLAVGINAVAARAGLTDHLRAVGRPSCLMFETLDADRRPSQEFRTVLLAELLTHGVLGQSLVTSAAHDDELVAHTVAAFEAALPSYARALTDGVDSVLHGAPVAPALRRLAAPRRLPVI
ncbi:MAG: glutamate-1-semialdehyde 2,1-aminomutase, partial [Propionibacteriales bacterium]|nr:glutamate-1-semialdehyde 2,1-aminomutase [Propionibacteriales bacterium]